MMRIGIGESTLLLLLIIVTLFRNFTTATALAFSIIIAATLLQRQYARNHYWQRQGIKGPEPNFFFGSTFQLKNGIKKFDIENTKKYGKIFSTVFLGVPALVISDLDILKEILVKKFGYFTNRAIVNKVIGNNENGIRSKLIIVLRDTLWKNVRNTITPAFTTGKIKSMIPILGDCIEETINAIDAAIENANGEFDVKKVCGNFTMDAIARCAFGIYTNTQREENSEFVMNAKKFFSFTFRDPRVVFISMFPNVAKAFENLTGHELLGGDCNAFFVNAVRKIIKERRAHPRKDKPDFLQLLLDCLDEEDGDQEIDHEITHEALSEGKKIKLEEGLIIAQSLIFMAAGYESTATTLHFCLYNLATNPHCQDKAYAQVEETIGEKGYIDYNDLSKMPYLEQVMKETLRMCPPAPRMVRECNDDITIKNVHFEKGCAILVPIYAIHYDEDYYPQPEKFDPERFSPQIRASMDPLTFLPFGYGPRNCIGMRFAQLEIRLALAYLLHRFRFTVNQRTVKPPLPLITVGITKPVIPIILTAERRQ